MIIGIKDNVLTRCDMTIGVYCDIMGSDMEHLTSCIEATTNFTAHSNHVTSSKQAETLICHTTMRKNDINCLYIPDHVML